MAINWNFIKKVPLTIILVAMNVIIMVILALQRIPGEPSAIMNAGVAYTPAIIYQKEYYRLFTSMFLHFDIGHLFGNMILLFFLGEIVENNIGSVRYLVIYLFGGLAGNLLSMGLDLRVPIDQMPISAGASGAVFALIGAMAYLLTINKGKLSGVTLTRLLLLIAFSVWDGFRSAGIDGAAHFGGLIAGFLLALILCRKHEVNREDIDNRNQGNNEEYGEEDENNMHSGWQS